MFESRSRHLYFIDWEFLAMKKKLSKRRLSSKQPNPTDFNTLLILQTVPFVDLRLLFLIKESDRFMAPPYCQGRTGR